MTKKATNGLPKRKKTKKGETEERTYCGYHWHFEHLLKCFAKKRLAEINATNVKETLTALAEVEKELNGLAEQLGKALDEKYEKNR